MSDQDKKTISQRLADKEYLDAWRQFKDEHPVAYSASAILPVTGQVAAVADYADAMDRGDSTDASIAAVSFLPGVGLAKAGSRLAPASIRLKSKMNAVEKAIAPITKRAKQVGMTADAEQVGETVTKEAQKAHTEGLNAKERQEKERREYLAAWAELG